jgi:hypothetical protein
MCAKGMHDDGLDAASSATCVGPGKCNLTQELSFDVGFSSILPWVV